MNRAAHRYGAPVCDICNAGHLHATVVPFGKGQLCLACKAFWEGRSLVREIARHALERAIENRMEARRDPGYVRLDSAEDCYYHARSEFQDERKKVFGELTIEQREVIVSWLRRQIARLDGCVEAGAGHRVTSSRRLVRTG